MKHNQYYLIAGYLQDMAGQWIDRDIAETLAKVKRLARKHNRLAEYDCNGEGYVNGKFWRLDDKAAYVGGESIFTRESDKVEAKIKALADGLGMAVKFQGDPRGYTVRLFMGDKDITEVLYL